jgi:hypothetical protein
MDMTAIIALLTIFGVAPLIVFGFILLAKRGRNQVEIMRVKRDIAELEVKKEEAKARALIEENRKYDRIIDGRGG